MKRRLPLILIAVITVLCVVGASIAAVAASAGNFSPVGYRVNDTKVSQATVDDDLEALADPDSAAKVAKVFGMSPTTTKGAVSANFATTWLDLQIRNELFRQGAEQAKVTVSDKDREAQRAVIDNLLQQNQVTFQVSDLPAPLEHALLDNYAYPKALGLDSDAKVAAFFTAKLKRSDIWVDPRYGFWSPRHGVSRAVRLPEQQRGRRVARGDAGPGRRRGPRTGRGRSRVAAGTRAAIEASAHRFVRTHRHPAVADLEADGLAFESFDATYDAAPDLEHAYAEIVRVLLASASEHGEVVYAVPGNPAVAERTVALLHEAALRNEISLAVVPGLSFADLAWARLGVDPMESDARVVDGRAIELVELAGPLLIAQCDSGFVISDVKLALLEHLDPSTSVTLLQRLGLPDERVFSVALEALDRGAVDPDHLTSMFVDAGATGAARDGAAVPVGEATA